MRGTVHFVLVRHDDGQEALKCGQHVEGNALLDFCDFEVRRECQVHFLLQDEAGVLAVGRGEKKRRVHAL